MRYRVHLIERSILTATTEVEANSEAEAQGAAYEDSASLTWVPADTLLEIDYMEVIEE